MSGTCSASLTARRARGELHAAREAIEALAPPIAVGGRHLPVREAAGVQLHVRPGGRQRRAEGMVIWRRVGRRIDNVDAHGTDNRRAWGDNARMAAGGPRDIAGARGGRDRAHLLRREHLPEGAAGARARRDPRRARGPSVRHARCSCSTTARVTARPEAARAHAAVDETIALERRRGKGENDSELLRRAAGPLRAAAERGLRAAPRRDARAVASAPGTPGCGLCGREAAAPRRRASRPAHGASRRVLTALAGALMLHRAYTVQSTRLAHARGRLVPVGGAARTPRGRRCRSASWTPPSSSTRTRSTSRGACGTRGGAACMCRRPSRFTTSSSRRARSRSAGSWKWPAGRDLYMRKHHSPAAGARRALADRLGLCAARRSPRSLLPGPQRRALLAITCVRRCTPSAARGCARPPTATTARRTVTLRCRAGDPRRRPRLRRGPPGRRATRRRPSLTTARTPSISCGCAKRVSSSAAGTSASHRHLSTRPADAAVRQQQLARDGDQQEHRRRAGRAGAIRTRRGTGRA